MCAARHSPPPISPPFGLCFSFLQKHLNPVFGVILHYFAGRPTIATYVGTVERSQPYSPARENAFRNLTSGSCSWKGGGGPQSTSPGVIKGSWWCQVSVEITHRADAVSSIRRIMQLFRKNKDVLRVWSPMVRVVKVFGAVSMTRMGPYMAPKVHIL